jgi:hypothetical protein
MFFSKWGYWQTAIVSSDNTKSKIAKSAKQLINFLEAKNYKTVITSGTLLGAVRNNGKMIDNDDDADLAVIFDQDNISPADINIKSLQLADDLKAVGYTVFRHSGSHLQILFFHILGQIDYYIDIFIGFFYKGNYCQPFHMYQPMTKQDLWPKTNYLLEGLDFPAVNNIDKYLSGIYGSNWQIPNSSFTFQTPYTIKTKYDAWFGQSFGFWHNFWESYNYSIISHKKTIKKTTKHKIFLDTVIKNFNPKRPIIDICCGLGEIISQLKSKGYAINGFDYSYTALYYANSINAKTAQFVNLADRYDLLQYTEYIAKLSKRPNFICAWTLHTLNDYIKHNLYQFLKFWLTNNTSCLISFDFNKDNKSQNDENPLNWIYSLEELAQDLKNYNLTGEILCTGQSKFTDQTKSWAIVEIKQNTVNKPINKITTTYQDARKGKGNDK